MRPKLITPALLRQWEACWTDVEIENAYRRRRWSLTDGVSPRRLARARGIPVADRLWVVLHSLDVPAQLKLARQYALAVIGLWDAPPDVREFLETGAEEQRHAARVSACNAAKSSLSDDCAAASAAYATSLASDDPARFDINHSQAFNTAMDAAYANGAAASHYCDEAWDTARTLALRRHLRLAVQEMDQ